MTSETDLERAVRTWISGGPEQLPGWALDAALEEIALTPQRRVGWLPRRFALGVTAVVPAVAATLVIVVAAVLIPALVPADVANPSESASSSPASAAPPTLVPIQSPALPRTWVSGQFEAAFGSVEMAATAKGATVAGSMTVSMSGEQRFTVRFACSKIDDGGVILIAGPVRDSTHPEVADGQRVALAIKPGEPVTAILWFEDRRRAPSCPYFLERAPDLSQWLLPVEGYVEFDVTDPGGGPVGPAPRRPSVE